MGRIVILDDDREALVILSKVLKKKFKDVYATTNPEEALSLHLQTDLYLVDQKMPEMSGIEFLRNLKRLGSDVPVIIMTAYGSIEDAVKSVKEGAFHYVTKPVNSEELLNIVSKALENRKLKKRIKELEELLEFDVVAQSPVMKRVVEIAKRVANFDTTVLITGESGVGKEVLARYIHNKSRRKEKPFIAVNCACIPENLLEAELFGYEKGAFTGAYTSKKGLIEEANGGTLFLDEVGELPLSLQPKILRFLQEKELKPLGSTKVKKVNVRVICATNRNLEDLVKEGKFREDLYYRLNVIRIHIPPLRERKEDILPLALFFIKKLSKKYGIQEKKLSPSAVKELLSYEWKGNVRELENVIERTLLLTEGDTIEKIFLDVPFLERCESKKYTLKPYKQAKEEFERDYLKKLMEISEGNISKASRISGKTRAEIYRLLKKYGFKK
ncbi:MAG: sigma-54-dependent Fis family transcriptional regulator [Aquifex sp.]|nr:MAG: sigma-54-dependent Fis family transcriptional regulator [Aquifex sp.]